MPLAIDLFCGLGGWTEGLLKAGYRVVGFDNERHRYPITGGWMEYPAQLVIQDVLTIHGSQFKDAALIVASPPCQEYSYMAMPWTRAKQIAAEYQSGVREVKQLTALFDACFRIQREASEAAGHHIPLVVENVCGAQKWVGRARWHYGSFYLWGDVLALMPITRRVDGSGKSFQSESVKVGGFSWSDYGKPDYKAKAFNGEADKRLRESRCICPKECDCQNPNGVGVAHCSTECPIHNDTPRYVEGCPVHDPDENGVKVASGSGRRTDVGNGTRFTSRDCGIERVSFGSGVQGGDTRDYRGNADSDQQHARSIKNGGDWFGSGEACSLQRKQSSKGSARKAASAHIAKIPLPLALHIAQAWKPELRALLLTAGEQE